MVGQRGHRREKALLLLKWFLLNPGRPCSIDELIDLGWRQTTREKATGSIHVAMHCLRRMLQPDLPPGHESSFVQRSGGTFYRFEAGQQWWTDADEVVRLFERARASDRQGDTRRACFYYGRVTAHSLHRFFEGEEALGPQWATYRTRYETLHAQSLVRLIRLHRDRGEIEECLEYAYRMLTVNPYNELAAAIIAEAHIARAGSAHARQRLCTFLLSCTRKLGTNNRADVLALCDRAVRGVSSATKRESHLISSQDR
jgi:DNA-binding SARP family transcriptional activator